jgi:hypothetical protein
MDNILDVQFADRGQVLQPGRMVRFGLTFEWVDWIARLAKEPT